MAIRLFRVNGTCWIEWYQKTASTAFAFNDAVALSPFGRVTPYTAGGQFPYLGLIQQAVAVTSATTAKVPVLVCSVDSEFLFDATTTAAALTDVGEYCDFVQATMSVNVGATTNNDIYVTQIISSTFVVGKWSRRLPLVVE